MVVPASTSTAPLPEMLPLSVTAYGFVLSVAVVLGLIDILLATVPPVDAWSVAFPAKVIVPLLMPATVAEVQRAGL